MVKHEINEIVEEIMARDAEPISFQTVVQNILDEPIAAKQSEGFWALFFRRSVGQRDR